MKIYRHTVSHRQNHRHGGVTVIPSHPLYRRGDGDGGGDGNVESLFVLRNKPEPKLLHCGQSRPARRPARQKSKNLPLPGSRPGAARPKNLPLTMASCVAPKNMLPNGR